MAEKSFVQQLSGNCFLIRKFRSRATHAICFLCKIDFSSETVVWHEHRDLVHSFLRLLHKRIAHRSMSFILLSQFNKILSK